MINITFKLYFSYSKFKKVFKVAKILFKFGKYAAPHWPTTKNPMIQASSKFASIK
jgi:hypothetical protein